MKVGNIWDKENSLSDALPEKEACIILILSPYVYIVLHLSALKLFWWKFLYRFVI